MVYNVLIEKFTNYIFQEVGCLPLFRMEKKEIKQYLFFAVTVIIVCYVVMHFSVFEHLIGIALSAMFPLGLGVMIAYIFNIILTFFEKRYFPKSQSAFIRMSRRPVCLVVSFLCAVGIIVLVLNIVIPEIINALKLITAEIPPLLTMSRDYILEKLAEYPDIQSEVNDFFNEFDYKSLDWTSITGKAADFVQNGLMGIISSALGIVGAVTGTVANIVIAVIFAIYLLMRKDKLLTDINRFENAYLSEKLNRKINRVCKVANDTFQSFFIGQFLEAFLLGCLCFIGMSILRLPYAAMSGTLVGVTALIPIVGAFLGAGISAFIIFTESPTQALIFLIFLVILQQLENNIIYPKVVGNSIGLPGIWVLVAVTVGGGLWGVVGMLIGVPLAATMYKLVFETLENKEKKLGIELSKAEETPQKSGNILKSFIESEEKKLGFDNTKPDEKSAKNAEPAKKPVRKNGKSGQKNNRKKK